MKFLSLEFLKDHAHIDTSCTDALLEMYGDAAEQKIANLLNRGKTVQEMIDSLTEEYGSVPADIYEAGCMLVAERFDQRNPASQFERHAVPYAIDMNLKPYITI